jgi:hypothetical protein
VANFVGSVGVVSVGVFSARWVVAPERTRTEISTRGGTMSRPSAAQSWMLALWSVYIAAWAVASGSGPTVVAAWWLAGLGALQLLGRLCTAPRN